MPIVTDKSGNGQQIPDPRLGGTYDIQAIAFRGTKHELTISGTAATSAAFSNKCRAIRIAPNGNIRYRIATAPTAVATDEYLAAGAVEILPVKPASQSDGTHLYNKISIIQDGAATGKVTITEDL